MKMKGQAAMEYLMTYGWAIIIIIVAVAALYAMGVFNLGGTAVPCSPCFGYFAFIDYANDTLKIRNGAHDIQSMSIDTGTLSTTTPDPGDDITVTGLAGTGDLTLTITYNLTSSGLVHTDSATIHRG